MIKTLAIAAGAVLFGTASAQIPMSYANRFDLQAAGRYELREADWRNGPIVYQVLVDRFAPSAALEAAASANGQAPGGTRRMQAARRSTRTG